ncbi:ankyrin repeat and BTB/POZ domain-containing protein 2 isoform X1 [Drosophila kikkawai]|uniref:Ankyrin repeat and BTB/POZ domain-containing protein 2 isoform X1 n=1 Tax=Drosophila kikkawai TaxID=30033 RepID=A0A6P4HLK3_DROKI|nr:ankyrin repeat and BTB/POZ domain-containing protein 2 isoform X1 [Drosophila kikkawai]
MYCTKDCTCSLCRELRGYKPSGKKVATPKISAPASTPPSSLLSRMLNDNFILRRRGISLKNFQPQSLRNSEMLAQQLPVPRPPQTPSPTPIEELPDWAAEDDSTRAGRKPNHKVVIYFGDSINRGQHSPLPSPKELHSQLLQEMSQKLKTHEEVTPVGKEPKTEAVAGTEKIKVETTPTTTTVAAAAAAVELRTDDELPPYIESVQNGVINIRIEGNYRRASALVETVAKPTLAVVGPTKSDAADVAGDGNDNDDDDSDDPGQDEAETDSCDWSYVQEWRRAAKRPTGNLPPNFSQLPAPSQITGLPPVPPLQLQSPPQQQPPQQQSLSQTPHGGGPQKGLAVAMATPAPRVFKELAQQPNNNKGFPHKMVSSPGCQLVSSSSQLTSPVSTSKALIPQRAVAGPARLTVQSTPVKSQPPQLSGRLNQVSPSRPTLGIPTTTANSSSARTHQHDQFRALQRVQECHSSSDENRSSGHASMSDTGGHSSSPAGGMTLGPLPEDRLAAGVTNRSTRSRRHRGIMPAGKAPWSGTGLEDIKLAMLTLRSQTSSSTYSSLSAGSESSEPARRLGRYSSLETVVTTTSADEFVWVDSHNRLVELQHPPWSQPCILRVLRNGRCQQQSEHLAVEAVSRLGYLLQRALVRIAREIQRFSAGIGLCSKQEVAGALRVVLSSSLADSCTKACLRAAAMFAVPGESALKQSKSARAGLQLSVGRFYRWMTDARLGKFIHEYAAVYLCAGIENLLEEIALQCNGSTAAALDQSIASSGDVWGLLQPFAHLNAGRVASGALALPRWASASSLATCVGSVRELKEKALRTQQEFQLAAALSGSALAALFYFMRCSQLEHTELLAASGCNAGQAPAVPPGAGGASASAGHHVQELCYERAYVVLPPLAEWLRVAAAHAEHRSALMIDKDDIMQAARLLLPGVDCPIRPVAHDEELPTKKTHFNNAPAASSTGTGTGSSSCSSPVVSGIGIGIGEDTSELGRRATIGVAFKLLLTGRAELLAQAAQLLPPTTRYDTQNSAGLTALMIASIRNDEVALHALLDAGCDPNVEVPPSGSPGHPAIQSDTQHWTALSFAASRANYVALRILLERGGKVEGGARSSEEKCTLTPLQLAAGTGNLEIVALLLAHGANAFMSTQQKDSLCFAGSAQKGCFCAISVAAAHGHRSCLRKLLTHPVSPGTRDVLSLEEMLAEGDVGGVRAGGGGGGVGAGGPGSVSGNGNNEDLLPLLNKTQIKRLQEAMYHSAENNHLDITIELRKLGVPWTLHCWMHALSAAHDLRLDAVIDQLLQDFLQVCPDDYSAQFVSECLPLLFNIFRNKNEGTTLLLADIFATCFGWETLPPVKEQPTLQPVQGSRIDPKFVNNPELSDVTFRVEGKIFYGHKIVLVTASPRFQSMLSSKLSEASSTPTVQINDIRYHIFQLVMQFLYSGGCSSLDVAHGDVLELMAAASFFQLEGLLRYTEARCSEMVDVDNVVAMYIHAKVYNANRLLEYCQCFLLQNMVALLTYDDSVKRLLFAKKIPNHDVLAGLLQTLQNRLKTRKPNSGGGLVNSYRSPPPTPVKK